MVIDGTRILLRNWNDNDIDDLVEGLNNINVSKWLASVPFPYTENDAKEFIGKVKNYDEKSNNMYFAIILKDENKVIGGTSIESINRKDGTAGGGIWLNEKYQKNGYGSEAFGLRIKYAFENLGLRRLENGYFKENEKSKNMQYKFGYKDEGIRRKKFFSLATREYVDEYITGLLKDEWIKESTKY